MQKKTPLRFLITPNVACPYDQRMVKGLAQGLNRIGHYGAAVPAPLSSEELIRMCDSFSIDVVLQVNRTRDQEPPLPKHIRHISWYQDVYPETLDGFVEPFHESDILYSLGDPKVLGLNVEMPCYVGSLFTGVDDTILNFRRAHIVQDLDFSLLGGLPPAIHLVPAHRTDLLWYLDSLVKKMPLVGQSNFFWIIRKLLFSKRLPVDYVPYSTLVAMRNLVEAFYRPLRGELDIHELTEAMLKQSELFEGSFEHGRTPEKAKAKKQSRLALILKEHAPRYAGRSDFKARLIRYLAKESRFGRPDGISPIRKAIGYFSQSYPRVMDRELLIELASTVSDSLELYGPGLDAHEFTLPYLKGVIDTQEGLQEMYCRSKINLSNNTHGLGLHSRTLECMAVGGFLFLHSSPHDDKAGGMFTAFEPGVHYGMYTPDNFIEEAKRWLADDDGRKKAGEKAMQIIRADHCWHHRAEQIVDDLAK